MGGNDGKVTTCLPAVGPRALRIGGRRGARAEEEETAATSPLFSSLLFPLAIISSKFCLSFFLLIGVRGVAAAAVAAADADADDDDVAT